MCNVEMQRAVNRRETRSRQDVIAVTVIRKLEESSTMSRGGWDARARDWIASLKVRDYKRVGAYKTLHSANDVQPWIPVIESARSRLLHFTAMCILTFVCECVYVCVLDVKKRLMRRDAKASRLSTLFFSFFFSFHVLSLSLSLFASILVSLSRS